MSGSKRYNTRSRSTKPEVSSSKRYNTRSRSTKPKLVSSSKRYNTPSRSTKPTVSGSKRKSNNSVLGDGTKDSPLCDDAFPSHALNRVVNVDDLASLRAKHLVKAVSALHRKLRKKGINVDLMLKDMGLAVAKRFIKCQNEFRQQGRPTRVTIGYHYTRAEHLNSIQKEGLLSMPERVHKNVGPQSGGACYGHGIYSGRTPYSFPVNDSGLVVAILKGNEHCFQAAQRLGMGSVDTVVATRSVCLLSSGECRCIEQETDEIVLKKGKQCLPIFSFNKLTAQSTGYNDALTCHEDLQVLLDQSFNDGHATTFRRPRKITSREIRKTPSSRR